MGSAVREGILCSFGNPLLDFQVKVDKKFLDKWNMKEDDTILCDDKRLPMFDDLVATYGDHIEYIPGGAAQNTIRIAQWMLKKPKATVYVGCIGKDKYGDILKTKAQGIGVQVLYQVHPTEKTGRCAALITGNNRALCAHLAAANHFTIDHFSVPENWKWVSGAQFYYITGYFLTVCPPAIMKIAEHACTENKCFAMNLAAPFICQQFKAQQLATIPFLDILFGNDSEAIIFAKENGIQAGSVHEIALTIANQPKHNNRRPRVVIITQGSAPIIVAWGQKIREFKVPPLKAEQIVDTKGAGDAFAAGVLSQLCQGRLLDKCIDAGIWAARFMLQRTGGGLPSRCDYE